MRTALALVFVLIAQPALARCHAIWHYPWPQRCGAPVRQRTWFVEIKPEPQPTSSVVDPEELTRAQAIETLKQELRMRTTQALELQTLGLTTEEKRNGD